MIAILEKSEYNVDFHQIVDFIEASNIRYALTFNPTAYVSHIRQFWSTARIETMNEGTKILATIDGKPRTISKSSIRRNLKLNDEEGISSLLDIELFENHALMGYNILPNQRFTFQKGQISHQWKVTSLDPDEGSMQQKLQELMDLYTGLQRKQTKMATKIEAQDLEIFGWKAMIKLFEDKDKGRAELSGDDAPIKERNAANILTSRVVDVSVPPVTEVSTVGVPTVSGLVPTVSAIFTTSSVVTPYSRRPREISAKEKGKEKMVESDTPKKKKLQEQIDVQVAREMEEEMAREDQRINEQIARDAEIARIHAKEELKMMIDGLDRSNEVIPKHLHEYEQAAADLTIGEKIELINELKQFEDFLPMASKEEGERVKRKGIKLEQGSAKKMKTSKKVSKEDLKEMMQLVPVEEVYVEALQVKHLIIDWEIHSEGQRDYWKIIRLGGHTAVYQFFVDMLK
nr:hypothetical protein [Tanacetum cinerariifolium]